MSGVSAVPAFKAALVAACHTLYDSVVTASGDYNVATFYGWPTSYSDEMVIVGGASSDLGDPLMGSQRRRLETITAQVQYLCTLGGEGLRDRLADTATCPGHQHPSLEWPHVTPPLCFPKIADPAFGIVS